MGQLDGDTNRASNHYELKRQFASPLLLSVVCAMTIAAATLVLFLFTSNTCINLPGLQLFWSEVMASFWSLVCKVFTPKSLFILLNVLIVSILALGHLQAKTDLTTNLGNNFTNHYPSNSRQKSEISTPYEDGAITNTADDVNHTAPQTCMKYLETNSQLNLLGTEIHEGNVHSDTHDYQENGVNSHIPPLNLLSSRRDSPAVQNKVNEAPFFVIAHGAADAQSVMRQGTAEMRANVHLRTAETEESIPLHCSIQQEEKSATKRAGKAAKAVNDALIESVSIKKASFFARDEASRPLEPSVPLSPCRKVAEPNDRPHSPLKTILKRGDTLEATWKAICERKRQSSPFKLHHHHHHHHPHHQGSPTKSRNTLLNAVNNVQHVQRRELLGTQREPSISQEELNAKVESFISRFHARTKIQREKSLLEFKEMVGRGTK